MEKIRCEHCSNELWFRHEIIDKYKMIHQYRCIYCGWACYM